MKFSAIFLWLLLLTLCAIPIVLALHYDQQMEFKKQQAQTERLRMSAEHAAYRNREIRAWKRAQTLVKNYRLLTHSTDTTSLPPGYIILTH